MGDQPIHVTVWADADAGTAAAGADAGARRAVLVHGTMTWGEECFEAQRPLAEESGGRFRLEVIDRRGFGDSPDTPRSDWEVDAADVAELLGSGAHLVGHSYGGVVAMAAAVLRPEAVRSLVLIEPSALRVAEADPVVAAGLARNRRAFEPGSPALPVSPEDYLRSGAAFGMPVPEFTPRRLRATRTAMAERPCWEAEIPLEPLARAPWPKLVVNGGWDRAHPEYRQYVGDALLACGRFIAPRIGARSVLVPGTDHFPHRDRPDLVNALLRETWEPA